jgi:hypothetical protein
MVALSNEVVSRQSNNSTVDMPHFPHMPQAVSPNLACQFLPMLPSSEILQKVKVEILDPIIELSSESEEESPNFTLREKPRKFLPVMSEKALVNSVSNTPSNSHAQTTFSRPPLHPTPLD